MAVQTISPKTEFHVASAHQYDQSTPLRWILAHLGRYKWWLAAFFLGMTVTNIFNAAIPRQMGCGFNVSPAKRRSANRFRPLPPWV
jgi:hypothetical protein